MPGSILFWFDVTSMTEAIILKMQAPQCLACMVQDRDGDEDDAQFNLSRFVPMLQEVVEDLSSNRLSTDEYPYVRPPTSESMSEWTVRP